MGLVPLGVPVYYIPLDALYFHTGCKKRINAIVWMLEMLTYCEVALAWFPDCLGMFLKPVLFFPGVQIHGINGK